MPHLAKYNAILRSAEEDLNQLIEIDDVLLLAEKSIEICIRKLSELREKVIQAGFKDKEIEITFFKEVKPKLVSHLIYHNSIY